MEIELLILTFFEMFFRSKSKWTINTEESKILFKLKYLILTDAEDNDLWQVVQENEMKIALTPASYIDILMILWRM